VVNIGMELRRDELDRIKQIQDEKDRNFMRCSCGCKKYEIIVIWEKDYDGLVFKDVESDYIFEDTTDATFRCLNCGKMYDQKRELCIDCRCTTKNEEE
jgi:hypothetical protein